MPALLELLQKSGGAQDWSVAVTTAQLETKPWSTYQLRSFEQLTVLPVPPRSFRVFPIVKRPTFHWPSVTGR